LFPDRARVPGRKAKYILAITFLISFYSIGKIFQQKVNNGTKDLNIQKLHRKVSPFFSSLQDVE
jgi:hypothetical protein